MALNLSYALAKQGRTCLVDADLRKGRLARAFGLTSNEGLSEVLREDLTLDNALLEVPGMPSLSILPAGTLKGNAGQLICSQSMQQSCRTCASVFSSSSLIPRRSCPS